MTARVLPVLCALSACSEGGTSPDGGAGGCPTKVEPAFLLEIVRSDGAALPNDLRLEVEWSAGVEPVVRLDEPSTFHEDEAEANVTCSTTGTPPESLRCDLWTSGKVRVAVEATGVARIETELRAEDDAESCSRPPLERVTLKLQDDTETE